MNRKEFIKIFKKKEVKWEGDNAYKGLQIIAKYIDTEKKDIICGADHDVIYSVDIDEILQAGITKEDAEALRKLNWGIESESYLYCFV